MNKLNAPVSIAISKATEHAIIPRIENNPGRYYLVLKTYNQTVVTKALRKLGVNENTARDHALRHSDLSTIWLQMKAATKALGIYQGAKA